MKMIKAVNAVVLTISLVGGPFSLPMYASERQLTQRSSGTDPATEPTRPNESTADISQTTTAGYDTSRDHLRRAKDYLREAGQETAQGLKEQVKRAREQLDALSKRLEQSAGEAKTATISTARQVEEKIAMRTHRMEARALLLRAKGLTDRAITASAKHDFQRAEALLTEATSLVQNAQETLGDDHAYDQQLERTKLSLVAASEAVKAHAENARAKINAVLRDTDTIVSSLETDETTAASEAQ